MSLRVPSSRSVVLALILFSAALALQAEPAGAHRVNIFAWLEGGSVSVECRFSRSSPAVQSHVTVFDAASGEVLAEGLTSEKGLVVFPLTTRMIAALAGLRFHVDAGEGHQNDFVMPPDDLLSEAERVSASVVGTVPGPKAVQAGGPAVPGGTAFAGDRLARTGIPDDSIVTMTRGELENLVGQTVDRRLAPIKRALAAESGAGPGLTEIVGGIGWILGIFGAAALVMARRRP